MKRLFRPKRYNPIEVVLKSVPGLSGITGIRLTPTAYAKMTEDPYLREIPTEGEVECWYGEGNDYYPPIKYTLLRERDGGAILVEVEYDDEQLELSSEVNFEINYLGR